MTTTTRKKPPPRPEELERFFGLDKAKEDHRPPIDPPPAPTLPVEEDERGFLDLLMEI